jgi:hypothetical protein
MRRRRIAGHRPSLALVCLATLGASAWAPALAAFSEDASPVTLPTGGLSPEAAGIRKLLEAYIKAVEAKDVQLFRAVKPNMTEEEERRARLAFKSIQSQLVKMNVLSVDVKEARATVKVSRRDTINGSIVSSFPQTFQLAKQAAGWTIEDIGR